MISNQPRKIIKSGVLKICLLVLKIIFQKTYKHFQQLYLYLYFLINFINNVKYNTKSAVDNFS